MTSSRASTALIQHLARFDPFDHWIDDSSAVHEGDLLTDGDFRAPALCTLIAGGLTADVVDLSAGFDEGGLFIVLGDVACRHFIGHYGVQCFIDGDISATESILAGFGDSSMNVIGSLRTQLFVGADIVCEVGGAAHFEYGIGSCASLGYAGTGGGLVQARHDETETARIVAVPRRPRGFALDAEQCASLVRSGRSLFR